MPTCTAFRLSLMCILSTSDSGTCKKQNKVSMVTRYPWLQGIYGPYITFRRMSTKVPYTHSVFISKNQKTVL